MTLGYVRSVRVPGEPSTLARRGLCNKTLVARLGAALDLRGRPLDADESAEPSAPLPVDALERFPEVPLVGGGDGARGLLELLGAAGPPDDDVRSNEFLVGRSHAWNLGGGGLRDG